MSIIEKRGMYKLELPKLTALLYHAGTTESVYYSNRHTIEDSMTQTVLYYDKEKNNLITFDITMRDSYGYTEKGEVVKSIYDLFEKNDFEQIVIKTLNDETNTYIEVSAVPDIEDGTYEITINVYKGILKNGFYGSLISYFKLLESISKNKYTKHKKSYCRI